MGLARKKGPLAAVLTFNYSRKRRCILKAGSVSRGEMVTCAWRDRELHLNVVCWLKDNIRAVS